MKENLFSFRVAKKFLIEKKDVEEEIETMIKFKDGDIYLDNYSFDTIPKKLVESINANLFENVKKLSLNKNKLINLDGIDFKYLPNLEILDLSDNKLTDLPSSLIELDKLKEIKLCFNSFKKIPEVLYEISSIEEIHVRNCHKIKKFNFKNTKYNLCINIDNHPILVDIWNCIEKNYGNIQIIWNNVYPDSVIKNLFIGGILSTQHEYIYNYYDISCIFSIQNELQPLITDNTVHFVVNLDDTTDTKLDFIDFIDNIDNMDTTDKSIENNNDDSSSLESYCKKNSKKMFVTIDTLHDFLKNNCCLVHCIKGISRSVSFVIAYLMKYYSMNYEEAYSFLKKKRKCVCPNEGFVRQLKNFEIFLERNK